MEGAMAGRSVLGHLGSALAIGTLLAACAVRHASPEGITIEHDSKQPELAVVEADRHCAKYGKQAKLVQTTAGAPSASRFHLSSSSVFDCVPEWQQSHRAQVAAQVHLETESPVDLHGAPVKAL
jgi:hypothetical protein